MSFETKVWIDRHSEFPTRRQMTAVPGQEGVYDMQRAEGIVYQDGDPFDQAQMNGLENRIGAAFAQLETGAQKVAAARQADQAPWGGITGKPATYPATAHTHTPAEAGAAPASHTHTPAQAGAAPASHSHPATQVTAGTLPVGVLATNSTDYGTSRLRNCYFATAAPGWLADGTICFVYE